MDPDHPAVRAEYERSKAQLDHACAVKKEENVKRVKRLLERKKALEAQRAATNAVSNPQTPRDSVASTPVASTSESDDPLEGWGTRKHKVKKEPAKIKKEPSQGPLPLPSRPFANQESSTPRAHPLAAQRDIQPPVQPPTSNANANGVTSTYPHVQTAPSNPVSNASTGAPKRLADTNPAGDRGRSLKAPRRTSQTMQPSAGPSNPQVQHASARRAPPDWYNRLPKPNTRQGNQGDIDVTLSRLKVCIAKLKAQSDGGKKLQEADYNAIRDRLHTLTFLEVDAKLLRAHYMLHEATGLPVLFDSVEVPWDIKADAEELYNKWSTGEFETDIYRGITRGKMGRKDKAKLNESSADSLQEGSKRFRLMEPKQHGNGRLLNGQWFPSQLAALRDGAHGSSQGGITGSAGEGAFSVILAGGMDPSGRPYPNEDRGNEVLYCGTDNKGPEPEPSTETRFMLQNEKSKQPVRLIRSHNLNSPYAPELGFRYDGLYVVVSHEQIDPPEVPRCRIRFKLLRCADQDPIRSNGPERRPTMEEIKAYETDRKNRGR
ncbi:hypothetical protein Q7P37_004302 [Cladosporium fusiforme]